MEFADQPVVQDYRRAFHQWRARVVRDGRTPKQATHELADEIAAYTEWAARATTRRVHRR